MHYPPKSKISGQTDEIPRNESRFQIEIVFLKYFPLTFFPHNSILTTTKKIVETFIIIQVAWSLNGTTDNCVRCLNSPVCMYIFLSNEKSNFDLTRLDLKYRVVIGGHNK